MEANGKAIESETLERTLFCNGEESLLPEKWGTRVRHFQELLIVCPTDIPTRCELATVLEELGQIEEALLNWRAVLAYDPNNLEARKGMARCRKRPSCNPSR